MKNKFIFGVVPVAGMVLILASCGGGKDSFELQSYSYEAVAEVVEPDLLDDTPGAGKWRCLADGVLPVKIGGKKVEALRDTLEKMAAVTFDGGHASPRLPEGYKPELLDSRTTESCSTVVNNLNLVLLNPRVAVWELYHFAYPCGAAHGIYSNTYLNYSVELGKVLSISDLFLKGSENELKDILRERLSDRDDLLSNIDEIEIPETFRITQSGIEFTYKLYEIAPYSSGEINVELDAYSIADILTDLAKKSVFGI